MSDATPPFADYPRGVANLPASQELRSLAESYYGLHQLFLINIAATVIPRGLIFLTSGSLIVTRPILALYSMIEIVLIGCLAYPLSSKIAGVARWQPVQTALASIFLGLSGALCCGIFGYPVLLLIVTNHMKRFGLEASLFGLQKPDVEAAILSFEANETNPRY